MSFSPAYHLRTNKTVERLLFAELLRRLDRQLETPIAKYKYVSLGGPYLEDFALIHSTFGNRSMTSLEIYEHIRSRQRINQPHSRIDLTLDSTSDFVDEYETGRAPMIVWFDYEWADWKNQIAESCELIQKLPSMSIFKITLSGKTDWLGSADAKDPLAVKAQKLSEIFADYGPFTAGSINRNSVCDTLYEILHKAVAAAVPDSARRCVRTLASYKYNDGTPILTVTMIIGPITKIEQLTGNPELKKWPFADLNWTGPKEIAVPSLSAREKMAVDRLLPDASARGVIRKLKFQLAEDYEKSVEAMTNYVQFYRHVPQFLRVTI
jgi:hypothetical protein